MWTSFIHVCVIFSILFFPSVSRSGHSDHERQGIAGQHVCRPDRLGRRHVPVSGGRRSTVSPQLALARIACCAVAQRGQPAGDAEQAAGGHQVSTLLCRRRSRSAVAPPSVGRLLSCGPTPMAASGHLPQLLHRPDSDPNWFPSSFGHW